LIAKIQQYEREKLTLVAALHLAVLNGRLGILTEKGNISVSSPNEIEYTSTRISEIQCQISCLMDEIILEKCELIDGEHALLVSS